MEINEYQQIQYSKEAEELVWRIIKADTLGV